MKIRVLVRVKERAFVWQERTIVKDEKKLSSMWTVREVLVDRPFDIDQAAFAQARAGVPFGFEHCEFCILAPPSRRLSQHLLQAMHHERRDQLFERRDRFSRGAISLSRGAISFSREMLDFLV